MQRSPRSVNDGPASWWPASPGTRLRGEGGRVATRRASPAFALRSPCVRPAFALRHPIQRDLKGKRDPTWGSRLLPASTRQTGAPL